MRTELEELVMANIEWAEQEIGAADELGYYCRLSRDPDYPQIGMLWMIEPLLMRGQTTGEVSFLKNLTREDFTILVESEGLIFYHDINGDIEVIWYADLEEMEQYWKFIEEEYEKYYEMPKE